MTSGVREDQSAPQSPVDPLGSVDPLTLFASRHHKSTPGQAMRDLCRRLLIATGQSEPPIGVERRMLDVMRADTVAPFEQAVPARLTVAKGRYEVRLRAQFWRRRRFSVAHEIGHMLVLDSLADEASALRSLRSPSVMPALEALCNQAAAELLMPESSIKADLDASSFDANTLAWLHSRYLVSWGALMTRLCEVLPNASLSLWAAGVRPNDPADRLRVVGSYGGLSERWLPDGISDRYLSEDVIAKALTLGQGVASHLEARFGSRVVRARALAARMPDDAPGSVALLLLPADANQLWQRLQAPRQLQLPITRSSSGRRE